MARPYWTGRIQVSLVSFGVQLFVATESKNQISFHQISRSTGERVRHQKVLQSAMDSDSENVGPAVGKDEIVKGYEYRKGEYIIIEPTELENLRVPSKHTIEVNQFVGLDELLPEYIEKPYFVADGQIAKPGEQLENLDIALGEMHDDRRAIRAQNGVATPSRHSLLLFDNRVHVRGNTSKANGNNRSPRRTSGCGARLAAVATRAR